MPVVVWGQTGRQGRPGLEVDPLGAGCAGEAVPTSGAGVGAQPGRVSSRSGLGQAGGTVAARTAWVMGTRMPQTGNQGRGQLAGLREVHQWWQGWPWATNS